MFCFSSLSLSLPRALYLSLVPSCFQKGSDACWPNLGELARLMVNYVKDSVLQIFRPCNIFAFISQTIHELRAAQCRVRSDARPLSSIVVFSNVTDRMLCNCLDGAFYS